MSLTLSLYKIIFAVLQATCTICALILSTGDYKRLMLFIIYKYLFLDIMTPFNVL